MIPVDAIDEASQMCLDMGITILQGFRLADTDAAHIALLLGYMAPEPGSSWLDIGCGFGEPARLMQELRPDLHFTLVSNNAFQLGHVPDHLRTYKADMHDMPFNDGEFDGAMFLYSLCHAVGLIDALQEAARVVRSGGRLFVFDYLREQRTNALTQQHLGANFFEREVLRRSAELTGWHMSRVVFPGGSDAVFRAVFGDQALYDDMFADLRPVIWTATRQ